MLCGVRIKIIYLIYLSNPKVNSGISSWLLLMEKSNRFSSMMKENDVA